MHSCSACQNLLKWFETLTCPFLGTWSQTFQTVACPLPHHLIILSSVLGKVKKVKEPHRECYLCGKSTASCVSAEGDLRLCGAGSRVVSAAARCWPGWLWHCCHRHSRPLTQAPGSLNFCTTRLGVCLQKSQNVRALKGPDGSSSL